MELSIKPLPSEAGEPRRRRGENIVGVRVGKDTRRARPVKSTKQDSYGLTETEPANMGPAWAWTMPSVFRLWLLAWWLCGTLRSWSKCISFVCSQDFSSYWVTFSSLDTGAFASSSVSCFVLFDCCLLETYSFWKGNKRGADLMERGNGVGGRSGWRRNCGRGVLYERKKYFFLFLAF